MILVGHNKKIFLDRRRQLRKRQTDAEMRLWQRLRGKRFLGLKFCRQYGVGPYILDFFCFEAHLAIEIDGGQHATPAQAAYDAERTAFLEASGLSLLRFWNHEVMRTPDSVLEKIRSVLQDLPPTPLFQRAEPHVLP